MKTDSIVYTQEMNDNGILPSEGMEFLDSGSADPELKRICLLVDGDNAVYKDDALGYIGATIEECEPLPAPVKLINGKAYQFTTGAGGVFCGIYSKYRNIFSVQQGQYFDRPRVTNIQQLTVETK